MRWFSIQRRLFATLSITVLAGGMALLTGGAAFAARVSATPFDVQGNASLQFTPAAGGAPLVATLLPTAPISGAIDDAGGLTISPANLSTANPIDRVTNTLLASPLDVVELTVPTGFTGSINPAAGNVAITGTGAFFTFSGDGYQCATAPADLTLYAVTYDPTSGAASFATDDGSFVFPAFTKDLCSQAAGFFNKRLNLPTTPGVARLTVDVTLSIPSDPTTTPPPTGTPPTAGGGSGSGSVGSTAVAAPPKIVLPAGSLRPSSPKTAAPKSSTTTGKATTPTTGYVWKGGSDVAAGQFDDQATPPGAVAVRPPILPQESAAKVASDSGNRYGLGILVLVLGAAVAAVVLLRSEARRFFRRRERAAF